MLIDLQSSFCVSLLNQSSEMADLNSKWTFVGGGIIVRRCVFYFEMSFLKDFNCGFLIFFFSKQREGSQCSDASEIGLKPASLNYRH